MYDLISQIIGHTWVQGDSAQQYIYYTCCAIIIMLFAVVIDLLYRGFRHLWRGKS